MVDWDGVSGMGDDSGNDTDYEVPGGASQLVGITPSLGDITWKQGKRSASGVNCAYCSKLALRRKKMVKYFCDRCEKQISEKEGTTAAEVEYEGNLVVQVHVFQLEEKMRGDPLYLCFECLKAAICNGYLRQ